MGKDKKQNSICCICESFINIDIIHINPISGDQPKSKSNQNRNLVDITNFKSLGRTVGDLFFCSDCTQKTSVQLSIRSTFPGH